MRWLSMGALLVVLWAGAQQESSLQPTILRAGESHTLSLPDIGFFGISCDGDGHLFYQLRPANFSVNDSVVMKLDVASETPTVYAQPSGYAGNAALISFSLTPSGSLWYLDEMKSGGYTAVAFDSDGEAKSETQLDTPPGLFVTRFAVSEDESILVGGFFTREAPPEKRGQSYLAFFKSSGVLAANAGQNLTRVNLRDFEQTGNVESAVMAGKDGNFYVLNGNSILVFSESGELVRRIKFQPPDNTGEVYKFDLSDGLLSIEFLIPTQGTKYLHPEFLVLESATGAPFAFYKTSGELGDVCLCFSRRDGYLFSKIANGKIELVSAPLR